MPRFLGSVLLAALALLSGSGCVGAGQTQVRVENAGTVALNSVWLFATGDSVYLGALAPGQHATAQVRPTGESHLEFTHAGAAERIVADTYFEPGYRGPVRVQLQPGRAEVLQHARR